MYRCSVDTHVLKKFLEIREELTPGHPIFNVLLKASLKVMPSSGEGVQKAKLNISFGFDYKGHCKQWNIVAATCFLTTQKSENSFLLWIKKFSATNDYCACKPANIISATRCFLVNVSSFAGALNECNKANYFQYSAENFFKFNGCWYQ